MLVLNIFLTIVNAPFLLQISIEILFLAFVHIRIAARCGKQPLFGLLGLVPIFGLWVLWELGNDENNKQEVTQKQDSEYEKQVIKWISWALTQNMSKLQIKEKLIKESELPEEDFDKLWQTGLKIYKQENEI